MTVRSEKRSFLPNGLGVCAGSGQVASHPLFHQEAMPIGSGDQGRPHAPAQDHEVGAGGRTREYRMKVAEPEPGRILTESDTDSSAVTTFTVSPQGGASIVQISTAWDGAGGIGGLFERMFAPRVLRAIYADELERLEAYAREHHPT
jgi:hypothetical protein